MMLTWCDTASGFGAQNRQIYVRLASINHRIGVFAGSLGAGSVAHDHLYIRNGWSKNIDIR